MTSILRISTPEKEGVYQGSKWLKFQVLCDRKELEALFSVLDPFYIFPLGGFVDGAALEQKKFLDEYGSWIEGLKQGHVPEDRQLRSILAAAFTEDLEALWLHPVPGKGFLPKISKPVLQVQAHWFSYSEQDRVFRPMSMGLRSVFWGLQFSYPQIYQDAKTMDLLEADRGRLFERLRVWVREFTRPTPFLVNSQKTNAPIRIGKSCLEWIRFHPQLKEQGISIDAS